MWKAVVTRGVDNTYRITRELFIDGKSILCTSPEYVSNLEGISPIVMEVLTMDIEYLGQILTIQASLSSIREIEEVYSNAQDSINGKQDES